MAKRLYCFYHPEHERGHDGCQGHGVSGPQRVDALIGQVRWWRQVAAEATRMRDDMAAQARAIARGVKVDAIAGLSDYLRLMAHSQSAPEKLRGWSDEVDRIAGVKGGGNGS